MIVIGAFLTTWSILLLNQDCKPSIRASTGRQHKSTMYSTFVFYCLSNAFLAVFRKRAYRVALMFHLLIKGSRTLLPFFRISSLYVLFLYNDLSFQLARLSLLFSPLTYLIWKENAPRFFSWRFSFFIIPLHSFPHSSISLLHFFCYRFFLFFFLLSISPLSSHLLNQPFSSPHHAPLSFRKKRSAVVL